MAVKTEISWCDSTWNPVRGCTKVSPGCANCYAERFAERFRGVKGHPFEQGFDVRLVPEALDLPLHWRKPRRIFVDSMSDLFHPEVPDGFIDKVFDIMERTCDQASRVLNHHRLGHVFLLLTKRPKRMAKYVGRRLAREKAHADSFGKCPTAAMRDSPAARVAREWSERLPDGIWLGVSVENQETADERIPILLDTPAAHRFVSCEPLLRPVDLHTGVFNRREVVQCVAAKSSLNLEQAESVTLRPLDWVIVGGESGPGARPCDVEGIRSIVRQCKSADVPCFVKQVQIDGKCVSDMEWWDADLRVQQFPEGLCQK